MLQPPILVVKDPDSVNEPFGWSLERYLARIVEGTVVVGLTWSVTGPDDELEVADDDIVNAGTQIQCYLSGGTLGALYTVTARITTNNNPPVRDDQSFQVRVDHK